jgi:signal peptidase I
MLSSLNLGEEIKDWVVSILIAVVLAFFIRYFIVELYMVEGPSMRPTLVNSERLVVNKFIYRFKTPEKGDVVVFRYPRDPSRDFIKRVIGVAGDTIEIKDGRVFLNGQLLNEPYILEKTRGSFAAVTVPPGHIFVMGDNRNNSEDSRFRDVGFVSLDLLKGKAVMVFWPLDNLKTLP